MNLPGKYAEFWKATRQNMLKKVRSRIQGWTQSRHSEISYHLKVAAGSLCIDLEWMILLCHAMFYWPEKLKGRHWSWKHCLGNVDGVGKPHPVITRIQGSWRKTPPCNNEDSGIGNIEAQSTWRSSSAGITGGESGGGFSWFLRVRILHSAGSWFGSIFPRFPLSAIRNVRSCIRYQTDKFLRLSRPNV